MARTYDIVINQHGWHKMWQLVRMLTTEVAMFGYATFHEDKKNDPWLYVDTLFVPPQEVSSSEVDFVSEGLSYAVDKAIRDGRLEDLRFCVHSHGNMSAFFSQTDDEMIREFGAQGIPWLASAVFNKKHETSARIDLFGVDHIPGLGQVTLPADVLCEADHDLIAECESDIKEFVKKQAWSSGKAKGSGKKSTNTGSGSGSGGVAAGKEVERYGEGTGINDDNQWNYLDARSEEEAEFLLDLALECEWDYMTGSDAIYLFDGSGEYQGSVPNRWVGGCLHWLDKVDWGEGQDVTDVFDGEAEEVLEDGLHWDGHKLIEVKDGKVVNSDEIATVEEQIES